MVVVQVYQNVMKIYFIKFNAINPSNNPVVYNIDFTTLDTGDCCDIVHNVQYIYNSNEFGDNLCYELCWY